MIIDRYCFSGVAFSAAKDNMDWDWCASPDLGLPKPDSVFFMEMDTGDAERRGGYGGERYEKIAFQKKVKEQYQVLFDREYWYSIPANRTIDECHRDIYDRVSQIISYAEREPINYLSSLRGQ